MVSGGQQVVWQIGTADHKDAGFALGPGGYERFGEDGFFVVGSSDPRQDWPYVQPGPADSWAGSRPHTFTVVFAVEHVVSEGACRLRLQLVDTQDKVPPLLRIGINGHEFDRQLPAGAGVVSLTQPDKGKPCVCDVDFPASFLKTGVNELQLTTASGSWLVYDAISLEAPAEVKQGRVEDFTRILSASVASGSGGEHRESSTRLLASVYHQGEPVEAVAKLDDNNLERVRVQPGRQTLSLSMPAVGKAHSALFALDGPKGRLASHPLTVVPGVKEIIVVFKTHFDIGYTDMASNVVQRYRTTMMDQALEVVDQNRGLPPEQQFVWTLSGWPMHKIFEDWPGQKPERKQRIEQALKQGRFVVHALPFTTHTELLEPEDLVRGLGYSSRLMRELGLELARDAKMTDVPEHTWMLSTLLHEAGVDFMMIGCNGASGPLRVPPLFWWQGPDGSRVLMRYSPNYGTQLAPDPGWPYRTWLAMLHTGDNHGPPRPEEVRSILERAAKDFPGVKVRIGRMSDFYDAIVAEHAEIPVVRGDAPDTWIHGPLSDPAGARLARHTRPMITMTEALNTELRRWGVPVADAAESIAAAYEQSLLYGEHTWGGSIGWIHNRLAFGDEFTRKRAAGEFERIEGSWDEHSAYIHKARDLVAPVLQQNLRALANGVRVAGPRVVVYNPLPWKRSGIIRLAAGFDATALKATDDGAVAPIEKDAGGIVFFARAVPPMGYRTYVPTAAPAVDTQQTAGSTIESPFFKATLDAAHGVVRSLIDKRSGRELVDATSGYGLGQYLYERFDGNQVTQYCRAYLKPGHMNADFFKPGLPPADQYPYQAHSPRNFKLRIEKTPVCARAVLDSAANAHLPAVTTRLVLYQEQPFADLEITLHDKPLEPWPEAGWLCLPLNVPEPQFRLGRLGSIIDPVRDTLPGANRYLFGLDSGLTVADSHGRGAGICSPDLPLVSLDTPGCWKYSTNFVPRKPVVFFNLFNNQWDTNFRLWNQGTWTTRVRLWSIAGHDAEPALITPSFEARYPLQGVAVEGAAGTAPATQGGLELSRKGILVTAFGANPDGPGTVLRLWEFAGQSGKCRVRLPKGIEVKTIQPLDLRGRPRGEPLVVKNGVFDVNVRAFAPVSLSLQN